MSDNIYKNLNLPKFFPEHIKVCFFQACDWNKHLLKFKLHRKNKAISKKEALVDFEAFKFAIDNLYCGKPILPEAAAVSAVPASAFYLLRNRHCPSS